MADRVAAVEKEIEQLKQEFKAEKSQENVPWYDKIFGTFKDDPDYDEAMRLGREYRSSQRPEFEDENKSA